MAEETKPKRTRRKAAQKPVEAPQSTEGAIYRAKVTASLLNVRERPEKASRVIRTVRVGTVLDVAEECDTWLKLCGGGCVMTEYTERIKEG